MLVTQLWPYFKPVRYAILSGFLFMLLATLASLAPPYLVMGLTNKVLVPLSQHQEVAPQLITTYLLLFAVAALFTWVFSWARTYSLAYASELITKTLRVHAFAHLLHLSLDFYDHRRKGDLISRLSETDNLNIFIATSFLNFIQDVIIIIMIGSILFVINPLLALVTVIPVPFIFIISTLLKTRLNSHFSLCTQAWSGVVNAITEMVNGIRLIKNFAQEQREVELFERTNQHNLVVNNRMNKFWALFSPTVTFITDGGLIIVWAIGIWMLWHGNISLGVLTGFIAYATKLYGRLESMGSFLESYRRSAVYMRRIMELLLNTSKIKESDNPLPIPRGNHPLCFENLHFSYGNKQVLFDINLKINPGEKIGLVGYSGAGKTTLFNLISRFYEPSSGQITFSGTSIKDFSVLEYRSLIGTVLQDSHMFHGSVADNISYGKPNATLSEIIAVAKLAQAHDFIIDFPLGYDTIIQEGGHSLSGGQKQRLSIARTLLTNPLILLLDEPTSAVDVLTEQKIQKALANLMNNRTTIMITHRLSSLPSMDKLVVIQKGRIIEVGHHQELMLKKGAYFNFYNSHQQLHRENL